MPTLQMTLHWRLLWALEEVSAVNLELLARRELD